MRKRPIQIGGGQPGAQDCITDVPGVLVGHVTLIEGDGPLSVGTGPVRTGVTVILPHLTPMWERPVFAGSHRLNGNGEMTGLEWIRESGLLASPVALTNTHSLGVVRDALIADEARRRSPGEMFWRLPVVGETWDGVLNDINGQHVRAEHVDQALADATIGPVAEGNVGGGTGMICHGFKGGIGSSSRLVTLGDERYVVGVLVQANHGRRHRLRVNGVPVGPAITTEDVPIPEPAADFLEGTGSVIGIVATDIPLLPVQLDGVAQRVGLGIARCGGTGENTSGDLFLAFSTAEHELPGFDLTVRPGAVTRAVGMLALPYIDTVFDAVIEATEQAILNALLAAKTMVGRDGITAHALEWNRLRVIIDDQEGEINGR